MTASTLTWDARSDRDSAVRHGADVLRRGGLAIFPTETVYGVGAAVEPLEGLQRLRRIKQRPAEQPFTVHLPSPEAVEQYVDLAERPTLRRLVRKTMPGPVTLVTEVDEAVIERKVADLGLAPEARDRLYHGRTIGLRCPDDEVAAALLEATGRPVVASSANPAGGKPPRDAEDAARALGDQVDVILDGGPSRFATASTVIRIADGGAEVVREGVYDQRYIDKLLGRTILFVCSGNTCRSPMAEAIARHELSRQLGLEPGRLADAGVHLASAGTSAMGEEPMTEEAERALERLGVPIRGQHRSQPLTAELAGRADVIYAMTDRHLAAIREMAPAASANAELLDPAGENVEDPIGGSAEVYLECARQLQSLIRSRLEELELQTVHR